MIFLIIGTFLWSLATGFREGYTWKRGKFPVLDYHSWRYIEQLGIVLNVIGAYLIGTPDALLMYIGLNWAMVFTVYEPALDWMIKRKLVFFKKENPYEILGHKWNMGRTQQIALTLIGLSIFLIYNII